MMNVYLRQAKVIVNIDIVTMLCLTLFFFYWQVLLSSAPLVSVDTLEAVIMISWAESKLNHITDFRAYADVSMTHTQPV